MATINISDLRPAGFDLFSDSENYMMELTEYELGVQGGGITIVTVSSKWCIAGGVALSSLAVSYIKGRWL
jgi:hypothetical protein